MRRDRHTARYDKQTEPMIDLDTDPNSAERSAIYTRNTAILLVEDENALAKAVAKRLAKAGYICTIANSLKEARNHLAARTPDLCILDLRLPDGSGLDLLNEIRTQSGESVAALILSAYGEVEDAVAAMKMKAADFLRKPIDLDTLVVTVEKILAAVEGARRLEYSRKREQSTSDSASLLGDDPTINALRAQAVEIGQLCGPNNTSPPTVLILGETGTGKDVTARLLHTASARCEKPFVHVDCAALPKELIEAELFGHDRGAFTSAVSARAGLIEAAEDGVVFLDEIAELPLPLQAKLLAVLERRVLRRVGSTQERGTKAWFIAATNRNVQDMVQAGEFRADLYFRLNVLTLTTPPLRERRKDIVLLAEFFLNQFARRYGTGQPQLGVEAQQALTNYAWPGNVRELRHLMERAVLVARGRTLTAQDLLLPEARVVTRDVANLETNFEFLTLDAAERWLIEKALERTGNNVSEAARQLGVTRMAMRYRMQKYDM